VSIDDFGAFLLPKEILCGGKGASTHGASTHVHQVIA